MELSTVARELYESSKRLEKGSTELFNLAKNMAASEREYRIALAHEIMELKDKGMSISLINEIARGNAADEKYKRDLAEAKYTAGRDSLKAISTQVNALQSILRIQSEV